ncbi:hypothetical protein [Candidatus Dactylopiibacterium carminicum]|nr:hypothetical protein [Candidatus Dactylopiibacterium carminicum]
MRGHGPAQRQREWFDRAWRLARYALAIALVFFALLIFERLIAPLV